MCERALGVVSLWRAEDPQGVNVVHELSCKAGHTSTDATDQTYPTSVQGPYLGASRTPTRAHFPGSRVKAWGSSAAGPTPAAPDPLCSCPASRSRAADASRAWAPALLLLPATPSCST